MSSTPINPIPRRDFLGTLGKASLGAAVAASLSARAAQPKSQKKWRPVSDKKVRMGVVGYGVCRFGAAFGFQDHPNVEIVAVSDLIPDRRRGLMKACRCDRSYESLEVLVKDKTIDAVFIATDAPSHARHCIEVLQHGKHVMTAVPATYGSLEDAEKLVETVQKTGLKYQMAETSCFRADCYAMRRIYHAGGFGRIIYSEGEYFHYGPTPLGSYKGWRVGCPPLWYPTHSTAYYIGATGPTSPEQTNTTIPSPTKSPSSRRPRAAHPECSCAKVSTESSSKQAASTARKDGWKERNTAAQ